MPNPSKTAAGQVRAKPESFRARELSASLTVKDIDKSVAWYCDGLGFTVGERHERNGTLRAVSLKAGDVRILLSVDDGAKGADRRKGAGMSLRLMTAQSVDDVAARMEAYGASLADAPHDTPYGTRAFRVVDPDGFTLVISTERKP